MDEQKQSAIDRIKQANNILVTVSANPTVDQLAACLGLTLMLNSLGKHAAAVFSGAVPSTMEFLQPEKTIEKNTDSLRDFIISLDKSKADKLRYKVEDKVVKIFITPYKTSIGEKDFEFSQGDFNVEVVVALGVHEQKDLDQAITAHGRILHDATVIGINTTTGNNIGTINWQEEKASSLSEMVTELVASFEDKDKKVLDNQVATSLLTGIVAETDRFSNARTTPDTMKASAQLMAAGANQQLVSTKLQEPPPPPPEPPKPPEEKPPEKPDKPENPEPPKPPEPPEEPPKPNDGSLQIQHDESDNEPSSLPPLPPLPPTPPLFPTPTEFSARRAEEKPAEDGSDHKEEEKEPEPEPEPEEKRPEIHIDEKGELQPMGEHREFLAGPGPSGGSDVLPTMGGGDDDEERPSGAPRGNPGIGIAPPSEDDAPTDGEPRGSDAPLLTHAHDKKVDEVKPPDSSADKSTPKPDAPKNAGPTLPSVKPGATTTIPDFTLPEPSAAPEPPAHVDEPVAATPPPDQKDDKPQADHTVKKPNVHHARDAVADAINAAGGQETESDPIAALNARPLSGDLHAAAPTDKPAKPDEKPADKPAVKDAPPQAPTPAASTLVEPLTEADTHESAPASASPSDKPLDMPLPPTFTSSPLSAAPPNSPPRNDPNAPPPVPPPMMPLITPADQ